MTLFRITLAAALCCTLVAGCARTTRPLARTNPPPPTVEAPPPPPPSAPPAAAPSETELSEDDLFARKSLEELNAERPLGDAFFDYDRTHIRDDARGVLARNAEWLLRWPSTRIAIEGHADERGTSEYNLALAEQRATAVRMYLTNLGVPQDRIVTVSKGEESPFCREPDEGCWQQNRRGHFIITAK